MSNLPNTQDRYCDVLPHDAFVLTCVPLTHLSSPSLPSFSPTTLPCYTNTTFSPPPQSLTPLLSRFALSCFKLFPTLPFSTPMRAAFDDLMIRHSEPTRHYHTIHHLLEIFQILDALGKRDQHALGQSIPQPRE